MIVLDYNIGECRTPLDDYLGL